uniref:Paraflagellar rod protein n=1 Tax=Neobodo designis TaxID=312471 RepID=A0A7S1L0C8_NEODS
MATAVAVRAEDSKRQARLNDTLRRSVLESDEASKKIHHSFSASKARADTVRHSHRALEQLSEFERVSSFAHTRRFNPAVLLEETGQKVGLEQLIKPGDRGSTSAVDGVMESLSRLSSLPGVQSGPQGSTALATFCTTAREGFDKCVTLLRDTAVDSATWSRMPEALFVLLEELASVPSASELIAEDKERIARMRFEIEDLEHRQQEAVAEGDMKATEELYFQRITVQEAMVSVFDSIFKTLDEHVQDAHSGPTKRVHEVHQSTSGDVSAVMHRHESLKQSVEEDIKRLDKAKSEVDSLQHARDRQARELREQSDAFFRSNLMQIEQCYSAIDDLQKQITKLSTDRTDALEQRLRFIQEEDCFSCDVANFTSFYKQHRALLECTLQTLEVCEEVTDLVDEVLCSGCNAIEHRLQDNLAEIEKCRIETHDERLKQFRQLYLTIGDLQYKKERNMEELEKKIEHTHIQQELAMETFNPKAKEFSEAKKALVAVRDEMHSQVQVLSDKATLHIEAFKPTEQALLEAGREFVHPAQELQQMNERRQQKLLEYNKLMSTESGGDPDDPIAPARATEQELEEEMRRVERERALQQQRSQQRFRQSRGHDSGEL